MQVDIMIWFQGLFENFTEFFDVFFMIVTAFGEELILFIVLLKSLKSTLNQLTLKFTPF